MTKPVLSVIIPTQCVTHYLTRLIDCFRAQSIADQMEVALLIPTAHRQELEALDTSGFASFQIISVDPTSSIAERFVIGLRHTTAPLVYLGDDHCFPATGWAEASVRACQGTRIGVGADFFNANPINLLSEAILFSEYGWWVSRGRAGNIETLPHHNMIFRREAFAALDADLAVILERHSSIQQDLQRLGYTFYYEPQARMYHANPSRAVTAMPLLFYSARHFGATRARSQQWSMARRWLYTVAMPLITLIYLARVMPNVWRSLSQRPLAILKLFPFLLGLAVLRAAGEVVGYIRDEGASTARLDELEFYDPSIYRHGLREDIP